MKILALESSALAASVAVCEDEELIAQSFQRTGLTHSATLMPMAESLIKNTGMTLDEIDVIAVAAGPGSFTGLRIGVSAAKGLAWAKEKPCAACSTLAAMAWQVAHLGDVELCPVMDARRQQVYNARFAVKQGQLVRLTQDRAIALTDLLEEIKKSGKEQILIGDGAHLCYNAFQESVPTRLAPAHLLFQTAWGVAREGLELARTGSLTTAAGLIPEYHRLSQAERERLKKEKGE